MKNAAFIVLSAWLMIGCQNLPPVIQEPWIKEAVSDWPDFALTNEIGFSDTTYFDLANSFLVNTGYDTLGVSCKHLFLVFHYQQGFTHIDLGEEFQYWNMYPKNHRDTRVSIKRLINTNPAEPIGEFNTLKVRDWIIFDLEEPHNQLYPLKIRHTPVKSNEIVYALGWGIKQEDNRTPALIRLQCIKNVGDYFYTKTLPTNTQANGRSGSPVIDQNGYLVGIVSGQEGNMGVIGGVAYLTQLFDNYAVKYKTR